MTDIILPKLNQTGDNEWADVQDNDLAIRDVVNGKLDNGNLSGNAGITSNNIDPALLSQMGVGTGLRGKCLVPGKDERVGTGYALMTTPDRVSGIILPTAGLIAVYYDAKFASAVIGAGRAAIHLNEVQLRTRQRNRIAETEAAPTNPTIAENFVNVTTTAFGLVAGSAAAGADVTTGQTLGSPFDSAAETAGYRYELAGATLQVNSGLSTGVCYIKAAAGTYDISVRYKASSGKIEVKERTMYVWVEGF